MTCTPDHIAYQIREKGFRLTPQRMAILTVLHAAGHLSPTEVYERVSQAMPGFTEPTVYRNLDFLARSGFVRPTHAGGGRLEYELAASAHHHLVCSACGDQVQIPHERVQGLVEEFERLTGFRLTEDHITFNGLCPHCKD